MADYGASIASPPYIKLEPIASVFQREIKRRNRVFRSALPCPSMTQKEQVRILNFEFLITVHLVAVSFDAAMRRSPRNSKLNTLNSTLLQSRSKSLMRRGSSGVSFAFFNAS